MIYLQPFWRNWPESCRIRKNNAKWRPLRCSRLFKAINGRYSQTFLRTNALERSNPCQKRRNNLFNTKGGQRRKVIVFLSEIRTIICDNFETVRYIGCQLVLITNRKSHTGFLYRHRWPWMIWNGVIALILRYFTKFDIFGGRLRHSGWR